MNTIPPCSDDEPEFDDAVSDIGSALAAIGYVLVMLIAASPFLALCVCGGSQ